MKKIIIYFLFFLPFFAKAQTSPAYHGGSGDGFASAGIGNVYMGVDELQKQDKFSIYPNPTRSGDKVNILSANASQGSLYAITIKDATGKEIMSESDWNTSFSAPDKPGIYLIEVKAGNALFRTKLVVLQ